MLPARAECGCSLEGRRSVRAGAFRVVISTYDAACSAGRHDHPEPRLVFPLAGPFETRSARAEIAVVPGTLVYRPPFVEHEDFYPATVRCATVLGPAARALRAMPDLTLVNTAAASACVAAIGREMQSDEPDAIVALGLEGACSALFASALHGERPAADWLDAIRATIAACEEHDDLSLAALSDRAERSAAYVARRFKQRFGMTAGAYALRMRLRKAYGLVRDGQSLAEAAARAGFADQSHFTRTCKAALGISPGTLRAQRADGRLGPPG